jgi:hypothetical protein
MQKKSCFVIAPIGADGSETRKRSNQVLKHVIMPAVGAEGYDEPKRADHLPTPGIITSQIVQHVINADLVIADLSEANPNVFYELAIRHAVRKPVVQIAEKGSTIPFDVAPARTVIFDCHDLDSVDEAKKRIAEQIRAAEEDPANADNPLSAAIDVQHWRASDKPVERFMAALLDEVRTLRGENATILNTLSGHVYFADFGGRHVTTFAPGGSVTELRGTTLGDMIKGSVGDLVGTTEVGTGSIAAVGRSLVDVKAEGRHRAIARMPDATEDKKK